MEVGNTDIIAVHLFIAPRACSRDSSIVMRLSVICATMNEVQWRDEGKAQG